MFCFSWCLSRLTFCCCCAQECCCFLIAMQRYDAFFIRARGDVDRDVYRNVDRDIDRCSFYSFPECVHGLFLHHDEVSVQEVEPLHSLPLSSPVSHEIRIAGGCDVQQCASSPHDVGEGEQHAVVVVQASALEGIVECLHEVGLRSCPGESLLFLMFLEQLLHLLRHLHHGHSLFHLSITDKSCSRFVHCYAYVYIYIN